MTKLVLYLDAVVILKFEKKFILLAFSQQILSKILINVYLSINVLIQR